MSILGGHTVFLNEKKKLSVPDLRRNYQKTVFCYNKVCIKTFIM